MSLTPTQYTERRDTLAALLAETTTALQSVADEARYIEPSLIHPHVAELAAIRTKVFEDQFKLVLVARYQGGKSSTFNALAMGGREISPMGDGAIKCSASLISAKNCEDTSRRGVKLNWRTPEELAKLCKEVLGAGAVDLGSREGQRAARKAYEAEFSIYEKNKAAYGETKRELLPIVDLITRFVGDPSFTALRNSMENARLIDAEIAQLVRFPNDFSRRWPEQAGGFTPEEALFAFLHSTHLAANAPDLKRLGFEVVDCPGLLASSYDTSVAIQMISTADAVWYLLDGKAAGAADLAAIEECRKLVKKALFVSINLKSDINPTRKHITSKIMPHIAGQLAQAGVMVDLHAYHALLAFLAKNGAGLLRGEEDAGTTAFLRKHVDDLALDSTSADARGYWAALCDHLLYLLKSGSQEFRAAGGQLNPQTLAIVERESGMDEILGKLEQFVVSNRAKVILIDKGVDRAIKALVDGGEQPLAALENDAGKDESQARAKYEQSNNALTGFEKLSQQQLELITGNQGDLQDQQLAGEFFDQNILTAVPEIARKSAPEIAARVGLFATVTAFFGGPKPDETIKAIVESNLRDEIQLRAAAWVNDLTPTTSPAVAGMLKQAERITQTLKDHWQGITQENELLLQLSEPVVNSTTFQPAHFADFLNQNLMLDTGKFLGKQALITAALIAIAVALPGIGPIFVIIASVIILLIRTIFSDTDALRAAIEQELRTTLETQLIAQRSNIIAQILNPPDRGSESLRCIRESIVATLEQPIHATREHFEAQRKNAEALFQKKADERAQIAGDCRRVRENQVVPLRQRLEAYRTETAPLC